MWLYAETDTVDLKVNKALNKAKQSIMGDNRNELIKKAFINASGQMAIGADILAETTFLQSLEFEGLSGVLYSEESGIKDFGKTPKDKDSIILLMDPLDGSQNYKKSLPFGCISVAYGPYKEKPCITDLSRAAILNLYSNDLFFGVKGVGSWFNGDPIKVHRDFAELSEQVSQISFYAYGEIARRYFFDFQEKYSLRSLGSSAWELVLCAIGINDAYVDLRGVLRAHDFVAAKIILESVGGEFKFINIDNTNTVNISLDTFKRGYSVVASQHPEFVEYLINDFITHGLIM